MKKGGVDSHNIHTALYSACIFALIFIFSDLIKQELDKKNLDDKTSMFISFFIHFFLQKIKNKKKKIKKKKKNKKKKKKKRKKK